MLSAARPKLFTSRAGARSLVDAVHLRQQAHRSAPGRLPDSRRDLVSSSTVWAPCCSLPHGGSPCRICTSSKSRGRLTAGSYNARSRSSG